MKVLLAVDSQPTAEILINHVAARGWPPCTEMCVLIVVDTRSLLNLAETFSALVKGQIGAAQAVADAASERLAGLGFEVKTVVIEGYPRNIIVNYAEEWGADFVMIGALGQSRITRFFLGGVAKAVVRNAPCSVVIVRPPTAEQLEKARQGMRILLATDGAEGSLEAVRSILARTWPEGSELYVLSVAESFNPIADQWSDPSETVNTVQREFQEKAQEAVNSMLARFAVSGLTLSGGVVTGHPKEAVVDEAKLREADLVVVGTYGRRGIERILLGSVSDAVAMHSHCSVEVIRPGHS